MICKHILLFTVLNEPALIFFGLMVPCIAIYH